MGSISLLIKKIYKTTLVVPALLTLAACGPDSDNAPFAQSAPPAPEQEIVFDTKPETIPDEPTNILTPILRRDDKQEEIIDNRPARLKINVGVMLPLSGDTGQVGQAMLNAITMAMFDAGDKRLNLIPVDTRGTPEGAEAATTELIARNADIIIGPLFAGSIRAAKPIAKEAGLNMISFSTDQDVAGDNVFLLSFRPEEQVGRIIKYASKQQHEKFAALIPETLYGGRVVDVLEPLIATDFNELVAMEVYPNDPSMLDEPVKRIANYDYRRQEFLDERQFLRSLGNDDDMGREFLTELRNLETLGDVEFDAILLPEGGSMLGSLAPLLSYYEIDLTKVKVLGTGLWQDPMLFNEPQLQGGWFAAPEEEKSNAFLDRYNDAYGVMPPRLVTLGYDAMALVSNIVRSQRTPTFSKKILTDPSGFVGLDGIFRFHRTGLVERGLAVFEVSEDEFIKIEDAPKSFIQENRPLYVEVPMDFTPKFDPVFGLEGGAPSLSIEVDLEKLAQETLELSSNPPDPIP
ncbi:penicillin-binding protein activator [Pseudemcibacter aquimaris]|nr:penicillin-binding protein activator [Pseudemcibacter aquimaris]